MASQTLLAGAFVHCYGDELPYALYLQSKQGNTQTMVLEPFVQGGKKHIFSLKY